MCRYDLLRQRSQVQWLAMQTQLTRLRERERLQVVHQLLQEQDLRVNQRQHLRRRLNDAVVDAFEVAADVSERRAQLVRDVARERAPLRIAPHRSAAAPPPSS